MEEESLIALNKRGLFPGPQEKDELFFLRAKKTACSSESAEITKKLFHAVPDWVKIFRSAKGLHFWEAAATWIEEDPRAGRTATIQIKNSFLNRFYPFEETIAHEMVHAMRLMFDERRFEEILAFRTSKNRFRRYFGPLFSRPRDALGFILFLGLSWFCCLGEMFLDLSLGSSYLMWSPICFLGLAAARLMQSQRVFSKALERLEKAVRKPGQSLAVALRLTDSEIERFAKCSPQEIRSFAAKEAAKNLRWRQLRAAYFNQ